MPVEVRLPDLIRLGLVDPFEAEHDAPKQIAKRLEKAGLIDHFNFRNSIFTLARRAVESDRQREPKRPHVQRLPPQHGPDPASHD
jgi:hypothetical protein